MRAWEKFHAYFILSGTCEALVNNEITSAVEENPTLAASGLQLRMTSAPQATFSVVTCALHRSIPPGAV